MRPAAPENRPPVQAWAFAALALAPLVAAWAGLHYGWAGPWREVAVLWGVVLLGLSAGLVAGPLVLTRHASGAMAALGAPLAAGGLWLARADLGEAVLLGLALCYLADLGAARAGVVAAWWPRLKLGFTLLAGALLLGLPLG